MTNKGFGGASSELTSKADYFFFTLYCPFRLVLKLSLFNVLSVQYVSRVILDACGGAGAARGANF